MILLILSRVKIDIILFYLTSIWTGYERYEAGTVAKDIWEGGRPALDAPPEEGSLCLDLQVESMVRKARW